MEALLGGLILVALAFALLKAVGASDRAPPPRKEDPRPPQPPDPPVDRTPPRPVARHPAPRTPAPRATAPCAPAKPPRTLTGKAWVIDGDTIVIDRVHLRLFGIDAPELDHPYGKKAKSAMIGLCKGHRIRAEITENDHYDRCVARCFLPDGRDLSAELVRMGLAIDWPKYSGGAYRTLEQPEVRRRLWRAHNRQMGWPIS